MKSKGQAAVKERTPSKDLSQSKHRVKFEESTLEYQTSKGSWSELIKSDYEMLKDLKSPSVKYTPFNSKVQVFRILNELSVLKQENRILKRKLQNFHQRSESQTHNSFSSRQAKQKFCKTCVELLSKGYTTRFCPTHGHHFKLLPSNLI